MTVTINEYAMVLLNCSEHQEFGYCQVGTSLALLNDGTALMGSPGPFTWRGTIFAIEVGGEYIDRDKTVYIGPLSETPEPIDKYSYVGKFISFTFKELFAHKTL